MQDLIVFYDGNCGFCNKMIQFILRNEREKTLTFCSLQSEFAITYLRKKGIDAKRLNTLYVAKDQRIFKKSTAVLHLLPYLKRKWSILTIMWLVPRFIRDVGYDIFAYFRTRISPATCRIEKGNSTRFIA